MNIPQDKVVHALGGALVAGFSGSLAWGLSLLGLSLVPTAVVVGSAAAALAVEFAQAAANRSARKAGGIPVHAVSLMDAVASTLPGLLLALALVLSKV